MRIYQKKIKYKDNCYMFKHTNYSIDRLYVLIGHESIGWLEHKDINLFDEVEILEDNTGEIEEFKHYSIFSAIIGKENENTENELAKMSLKINELIKAVNKIRKDLNE